MKRAFAAAVILALLFLGCGFLLRAVKQDISAVKNEISAARFSADGSVAERIAAARRIDEAWQKHRCMLYAILGSDSCFPFESSLQRSQVWAGRKEKSSEFLSELSTLDSCLDEIWQSQSPEFSNLF